MGSRYRRRVAVPERASQRSRLVRSSGGETVGHVPRKISAICSTFIWRGGTVTCCVTANRRHSSDLPQGGLEIPCVVKFVGKKKDVDNVGKLAEKALKDNISPTASEPSPKKIKTCDDILDAPQEQEIANCQNKVHINMTNEIIEEVAVEDKSMSVEDFEKVLLIKGQKLTDISINWANSLLKEKFPNMNGLQSTLTQSKKELTRFPDNKLQIIHCQSNDHWILASTISSVDVFIYDSVFSSLNTETAKIVGTHFPGRNIRMVTCQKQQGGTDCGLFAIANATAIAHASQNFVFNQSKMRDHFKKCVDKNELVPFP